MTTPAKKTRAVREYRVIIPAEIYASVYATSRANAIYQATALQLWMARWESVADIDISIADGVPNELKSTEIRAAAYACENPRPKITNIEDCSDLDIPADYNKER